MTKNRKRGMVFLVIVFSVITFQAAVLFAQEEFILPIRYADALNEEQGLWPFGVRGGEHPQGHPGFDFEAKVGTPILASADGRVGHVGESGYHNGKTISIGHWIDNTNFSTFYTGSIKNIQVAKGNEVKKGEVIAFLDSSTHLGMPETISGFHFGLAKHVSDDQFEEICAEPHFTLQAKKEIKELHRISKYPERTQFPLLCNPCPPSGCF